MQIPQIHYFLPQEDFIASAPLPTRSKHRRKPNPGVTAAIPAPLIRHQPSCEQSLRDLDSVCGAGPEQKSEDTEKMAATRKN